jgi:polar amino acid transport system substrate-binding protein
VLGAGLLTGCTTTREGAPVPATPPRPSSRPSSIPSSSAGLPDKVTLGVFEYRPYVFRDGGVVTGQVVEVARAVFGELGVDLQVELAPLETVLPRMSAGGFDLVGGLAIAARNCGVVDFSVPDHVSLTALVVPAGNPQGLSTFTEVAATGARLAVVAGSLELTAAGEAGVRGINVQPSSELVLGAVRQGQSDCGAYDDITLRERVAAIPGLEVRPPFEPPGGAPLYGFGFAKGGDGALRAAFDEVLTGLHESGEWLEIAEPFGFTDRNLPEPGAPVEEACR